MGHGAAFYPNALRQVWAVNPGEPSGPHRNGSGPPAPRAYQRAVATSSSCSDRQLASNAASLRRKSLCWVLSASAIK